MKKITVLLFALLAGAFAMQVNAAPGKAPARSAIYYTDQGFSQLGSTSIYYDISQRTANGPGPQYGISILGRVINTSILTSWLYPYRYYSSTFESNGPGAGFIAAFQVNGGDAKYLDARNGHGSDQDGVHMSARIVPQGDVAARIIYTLENTTEEAVTVNAGVWADIMIGNNDKAPLSRMKNTFDGETYGIKMKHRDTEDENTVFLCVLFGDHVTGVTPADSCWFGFYSSNWHANEICGEYSKTIHDTNVAWGQSYAQYWEVENGDYDSGLGFCWMDREIPAGESIELSYLISVGEVDFMEPIVPGEDRFEYQVEAFDFDGWNDLTVEHPARVWGYYEHPYGQAGYIEYQVDDENTWHRIPTELVSGENFDLSFMMNFNENRATDHVLALRFTDGLGNYTDMNGLSWTDVRSFDVSSFNEERVYNGEPQVYEITGLDGTQPYFGETNPGTYNFTLEGIFEDNTIGIMEVEYTIGKADPIIDVTSPAPLIDIDNMLPGASTATVEVIKGDGTPIITYLNTVTGDILTEAPTAIGIYTVIVEMPETDFYNGIPATPYGTFEIYRKVTGVNEINVNGVDNGAWYTIDGRRVAAPTERGVYIHNGKKYMVK